MCLCVFPPNLLGFSWFYFSLLSRLVTQPAPGAPFLFYTNSSSGVLLLSFSNCLLTTAAGHLHIPYKTIATMSKVYHSVPSDEERSSVDAEKSMLTFRRERGSVAGLLEKARAHWAWIGHAVLLSTSLTLFTLSLCRRGPQLTDRTVTENYSSYCRFPSSWV